MKWPILRFRSFGSPQRGQSSLPVFASSRPGLRGFPQLAQNLLCFGVRRRQCGQTRLRSAESFTGTALQYWQGVWPGARDAPQV